MAPPVTGTREVEEFDSAVGGTGVLLGGVEVAEGGVGVGVCVAVAVAGTAVTVTRKLPEAAFPAASVAVQLTVVVPTPKVEPEAGEQMVGTEESIVSAAEVEYVITAPPGPVAVVVMSEGRDNVGAVLSILIVTEAEFEPPTLFVAEQVSVVPAVSLVRFDAVQPVEEEIPVSGSPTDQLTVTSLMYQPPSPSVPLIFGVMTGDVASRANVSFEQPDTLPVQVGSLPT